MTSRVSKLTHRQRRHRAIRARVVGVAERPRVSVFRSNQHLYAQVIDDRTHKTLIGANDVKIKSAGVPKEISGKSKKAYALGKAVAEKMQSLGIARAVFDRGGFKYHGRVKAFAEGLRANGITI